jgi:hypothetical protein
MKLKNIVEYTKRMGLKYIAFRIWHEMLRSGGFLRFFYPIRVSEKKFFTLKYWRNEAKPFFINKNRNFDYTESIKRELENKSANIFSGEIQFFTGKWHFLGKKYDWLTNPETGYRSDGNLHWTKIEDFNNTQGDIKYVWEKARFSYIYTIIRNDHANRTDNSRFVWTEILSWIAHSSYNCGPHYKCSQEISLRVLNWIFALNFYKDTDTLTEEEFSTIINALYIQTRHVESNILFSKIAVRNNHAITESLCLFTVGLLFPWFPESSRWITKGQRYLEEEGLYQLYEDGSYIQHSFNYQRVAFQLYTWALAIAKVNSIQFSTSLINRLKTSIHFLQNFINTENGCVPNWGANDSALFFPLNGHDPKDFRPQVNALCLMLSEKFPYTSQPTLMEDSYWFSGEMVESPASENITGSVGLYSSFDVGGYYVIRTNKAFTYIRCARHRHRPFHADNLHVDVWWNHENIIRDAGTYKYNTDSKYTRFFTGSAGHNSVIVDDYDQMQKGKRFIWYNWSQAMNASIKEKKDFICFEGAISAFKQIRDTVVHNRCINVHKDIPLWRIHDTVEGCDGHTYSQNWNIKETFFDCGFKILSQSDGKMIDPVIKNVWFSDCYGEIQEAKQIVFSSSKPDIKTVIYNTDSEKSVDFNLL